jgi:hypothetical protein
MILQALTPWDMEHWLSVIQNSIFMALNCEDGQSANVTSSICADCGAGNASWSSINWGVTLCDACAGEHRALGASVSTVRSFALDDVDPMHRALVEAIGTVKANAVLECRLPPDEKPAPGAAAADLHTFVEAKYRARAWVAPADDVDLLRAVQEQALADVYRAVAAGRLADGRLADGRPAFGPIHAAAIVGNPIVLHLICLHTANVDVVDDAGWTPLRYAAHYDQAASVEILVAYGAGEEPRVRGIGRARSSDAALPRVSSGDEEGTPGEAPPQATAVVVEAPHKEVVPAEFRLEMFVQDPSVYRRRSRASEEGIRGD